MLFHHAERESELVGDLLVALLVEEALAEDGVGRRLEVGEHHADAVAALVLLGERVGVGEAVAEDPDEVDILLSCASVAQVVDALVAHEVIEVRAHMLVVDTGEVAPEVLEDGAHDVATLVAVAHILLCEGEQLLVVGPEEQVEKFCLVHE